MVKCELDHIVVGAASLEQGADYIKGRLGVDIPAGGKHPVMGTHNRLMRIEQACFLEVLAIDPEAPQPSRARWFGLDDREMQARLAMSPQLITWAVRSPDIHATEKAAAHRLGSILPLSRGHLNWLFAVPDDGSLHEGGVLPYVLEWEAEIRPWEQMADLGCRLEVLTLHHPQPEMIMEALDGLNGDGFSGVSVEKGIAPQLSARIKKADGTAVTL